MIYPILLLLLLFGAPGALVPEARGDDSPNVWQALGSDDGELTLAMPAACNEQLYVREGFELRDRALGLDQRLREMRSITCYDEQTLLSLDVYAAEQPAAALRLMTVNSPERGVETELAPPFAGVRVVKTSEHNTSERRLFAGRRHLYVATAAARGPAPTAAMKRFFDSLKMTPDGAAAPRGSFRRLSALRQYVPELIFDERAEKSEAGTDEAENDAPTVTRADADARPLARPLILHKMTAGWTREARLNRVAGRLFLRLVFGASGRIEKISVQRDLGGGLTREAVLAAMQTKFLPAEENGLPRAATMSIVYHYQSR